MARALPRTILRDRRGASAVEAALTLPVLAVMILGVVEFGRVAWIYNAMRHATDEAGRYVLAHADQCETGAVTRLRAALPTGDASAAGTRRTQADGLVVCELNSALVLPLAHGVGGRKITLQARSIVPVGLSS